MSDDTAAAAEATTTTKAKPKPEVTPVTMKDGRVVPFVGKRNLNKDYKIDAANGTVAATFDFRNGESHTFTTGIDDVEMLLTLAGHGAVQKGGDETSKVKALENGEPDVDSMSLAVGAVLARLSNRAAELKDRWFAESAAGDSFSGAAVVVRAISEATGKDIDFVKSYLEKKLEAGKAEGLTRQKLYQAYRKPGSKTAIIIARMEQEKLAEATKGVDVDAALEEMTNAA